MILDAVERVERAHEDLVGGVGVYRATRSQVCSPMSTCAATGPVGDAGERAGSRRGRLGSIGAALLFGIATIGAVQFLRPEGAIATAPLANLADAVSAVRAPPPSASPTLDAFGLSGEVKVRLALPGDRVEFPIAIGGRR